MARVNTYPGDENVVGADKLIGTDAITGGTKNFELSSVRDWLNDSGGIKIAGQSAYKFKTLFDDYIGREEGTVTFENYGGDLTLFSDITELIFSGTDINGTLSAAYISTLVGKTVLLVDLTSPNNFGVYTLTSYEEMPLERGFYKARLSYQNGTGALSGLTIYGFAAEGLQSSGGNWGGITGNIEDQQDLVDYVDNAVAGVPQPPDPNWGNIGGTITDQTDLTTYVSGQIAAVPTPTLDSVTTEGNTTANTVEVGGLVSLTPVKNYNPAIPDIGAEQYNDTKGYGINYVSNKTLAYCRISSSALNEEGAVRIKDNIFQTYIGGAWQDVVTNFRFREDENGNFELEHKPIGFTGWIEVNSGNSDLLGLNGLPITQNYATSMGAYPVPLELDGGTF